MEEKSFKFPTKTRGWKSFHLESGVNFSNYFNIKKILKNNNMTWPVNCTSFMMF